MSKSTAFALLGVFLGIFSIQSALAGPFGIDMGMSLAEVKHVCKTAPVHLQDNVYEITPPKTNDMFETYYVRIDPDYGVYWMKAIGKDIYTNGYGDRLKSTFESLVESIRKTYGEESYKKDSLKEGSIWGNPDKFMYALKQGDRELYAVWSKTDFTDILHNLEAQTKSLEDLNELSKTDPDIFSIISDSIAWQNFINERKAQCQTCREIRTRTSDRCLLGIRIRWSQTQGCHRM